MDKFERSQELERLQSECRALEEKAGLSQIMERAREGRFIPLGALGEKVTPDEYFADEHDHLRRKTRGAYFSGRELALRKNLIASARKVESCYRQSLEEDFIAANRAVLTARAKAQRQPWGKAAVMPEFFGNAEAFSGERDKRIDHESAYANTLQKRAVG